MLDNTGYTPTKPKPGFIPYQNINKREHIEPDEYRAWRASLPESGVDPAIRLVARGYYKLMDDRVAAGNRVFAQCRSKLGLNSSDKETKVPDAKKFLDDLRSSYNKITEGCAKTLPDDKNFVGDGIISSFAELIVVDHFLSMVDKEKMQLKLIDKSLLPKVPIWTEFLDHVKGCGPALGAFLIAELNPYRAPNPSSFHAFLGLDVHPDGRGMSKRNEHMMPRWMLVRDGKKKNKKGAETKEDTYKMSRVTIRTHDVRKKAKVVGVGAGSFLKGGLYWEPVTEEEYASTSEVYRQRRDIKAKNGMPARKDVPCKALITSPYVDMYMNYKHRLKHSRELSPATKTENEEVRPLMWCETSDGHRDNAAKRYMMKQFIVDLWVAWRKLEGLPLSPTYAEAKLGLRPHHTQGYYDHVGNNVPVQPLPERDPLPFSYGVPLDEDDFE